MRSLLSILGVLELVSSATIELNWDIGYVNANPDGLFTRRVIGVNGKWPIDPIIGSIGDRVIVHAHNSLDVKTSLHGHGLPFKNTQIYDGAVSVNHCGIPPGYNYTYTLDLPESGTYWFHSHSMGQYPDGLRTPLLVKDETEPVFYKYSDDFLLTLSDWYHTPASVLMETMIGPLNPGGSEPTPESGILNDGRGGEFRVTPGETYRIRLINTSTMAVWHVSVDEHDMTLIEVDGVHIQPKKLNSIELSPAQRASFLITAKDTADMNYYIHAQMDPDYFDVVPDTLQLDYTASLLYNDGTTFAPASKHSWDTVSDLDLVPLHELPYQEPEETHVLVSDIMQMDDGSARGLINGVTFVPPKVPTILSMLTTGDLATNPEIYGPQSNPVVLGLNKTVRVVIANKHLDAHPFHVHGHKFQVLALDEGEYDPSKPVSAHLTQNPSRRDTVNVPGFGHAVIQFYTDNPGAWPVHCHNNWHMMFGMMAVFIEAPLQLQKTLAFPFDTHNDICGAAGFMMSGNAAGNEGLDLTGAPYGPRMIDYGFHAKGIIALVFCIISAILGTASIIYYSRALIKAFDAQQAEQRSLLVTGDSDELSEDES
ncbi:Iron transport multicopper oxidase fio1 [Zancudomyces culisetae]|uniref:Iron transport multicopper oxidase fio1 n=1 Tax=Zancudomyces culisetae TaxID=1213189 RepID=A0A1R1PMJ7_ZANCU|nr:Iron transport multicopper oxidase fio1 [Zancudomyces culisetae]|eukprot:OMH82176.1 Iron transport multicopper oxidase fio1 [Zancudomyces culisetae]